MSQNNLENERREIISILLKEILELKNQGYSKEQMLEYISGVFKNSRVSFNVEDLFSKMIDVVDSALDCAIFKMQVEDIRKLCQELYQKLQQQMDGKKRLSYIRMHEKVYYPK